MTGPGIQRALAVIAEPTRFRILELLAERACTVSEVQAAIGALQPQTTKHIQALEAAGVIRVHKLGRRRVAGIDRDMMSRLASYFAAIAAASPDDLVLEAYGATIHDEESRVTGSARPPLTFSRTIAAPIDEVWAAWTDPAVAARWWAPRHFTVDAFELAPVVGSDIRLVLREGDDTRYRSAGRMLAVDSPQRLVFDLSPIDDDGASLFRARHTVTLRDDGTITAVSLEIEVSEVRDGSASAVAGLEPGWTQLLDALAAEVAPS
ncbi:MAG TPA: SRPBCC domain-containing protein [Microbacterium sp.]|nr:SRPBCC domain-containing protein [Microbacterium sp.]